MKEAFRVAGHVVRPDALEIEGPDGARSLEAKPMAVLVELASRPGEVCLRSELLDAVWKDRFVSEEVLTHAIWELRRVFGDDARDPEVIGTVPRRGYRLLAAVEPLDEGGPAGEPPGETVGPRTLAVLRRLAPVALLLAVALTVVTALLPEPEPRRVLIASDLRGADGQTGLELARLTVETALLDGLLRLEGLAPVDRAYLGPVAESSPAAAWRAAPAEEILTFAVTRVEGQGRVVLTRRRAADGHVLWVGSFEALLEPAQARLLADAVASSVRQAYPRAEAREGQPLVEVEPEAYRRFVELRRRVDAGGERDLETLLERAESIAREAPSFAPAALLAADLARSIYTGSRRPERLQAARGWLARAREVAPGDPRVLRAAVELALLDDAPGEAWELIGELERRAPGDVRLPLLRARLADHEGRWEEALTEMERAVSRFPSWQNLYRLADLEYRSGRIASARGHLEQLLSRSPEDPWALARLGELELLFGDVTSGAEIYERLTAGADARAADLVNLGVARMLLGSWAEAAVALRRAVEVAPDLPAAHLNLADAEAQLGRAEAARASCDRMLELRPATPTPAEEMMQAQCLVHLGLPDEAVRRTQEALARGGDQAEVVYLASLVQARLGDRAAALANARRARELGVGERWFGLPAFDELRRDPAFAG